MVYFHWIAGTILALAWFSRIVDAALGMPSVADVSRPKWDRNPVSLGGNPRVSIIVPARNEEETIEQALNTLLALDYENYEVIAVNDRSTDFTGEILERMERATNAVSQNATVKMRPTLRVVHHTELPPGWLGKTHAMWTAANHATGDWLLFTDADVLFKPDSVRRALAYAESVPADHVVLFPQMIMKRPGEYMMIAFFQTMFMFGHRPWKVADPSTDDHMGVGAFNLVRRRVYEAVGTYQALRMEVLDDMKLGKVVKKAGFAQRNVFGGDLISIRGWERIPYAVALGSMFLIYLGMSWRSAVPPYYFFLHPVSTTLFIYTLLRSMLLTLWNDGIVWRGTKYPLEELRKGMV